MPGSTGLTISAALTCYNAEATLGEQIDSILGQTRLPDEIVIGDAGSTDGTHDVIAAAVERTRAARLPVRWVVLPSERHLFSANIVRVFGACTSDVVVVCDHDDVCLPDRFANVDQLFSQRPDLLLAHCEAEIIDDAGGVTSPSLLRTGAVTPAELAQYRAGEGFRVLVRRFIAHGATTALRREFVGSVPPVPEVVHYDAWYALLAGAMQGVALDERPGLRYRVHRANLSGGVRKRSPWEKLRMLRVPGARRNAVLLDRAQALVDGLDAVRPRVADWAYDLATENLRYQQARARFPRNRVLRAPHVIRQAGSGTYGRLGRGSKDVLLDLVQPLR